MVVGDAAKMENEQESYGPRGEGESIRKELFLNRSRKVCHRISLVVEEYDSL